MSTMGGFGNTLSMFPCRNHFFNIISYQIQTVQNSMGDIERELPPIKFCVIIYRICNPEQTSVFLPYKQQQEVWAGTVVSLMMITASITCPPLCWFPELHATPVPTLRIFLWTLSQKKKKNYDMVKPSYDYNYHSPQKVMLKD